LYLNNLIILTFFFVLLKNVLIHNIDREEEIRQLRIDLAAASAHCLQLDEANRAWQKYQHDQIESFRQKLQEQIPTFNQIENTSLDFIIQQIINYLDQLNIQRDNLIQQNNLLKDEIRLQQQQQSGNYLFRLNKTISNYIFQYRTSRFGR
jgi:hypothetical protein